jgi:hypothetical protein
MSEKLTPEPELKRDIHYTKGACPFCGSKNLKGIPRQSESRIISVSGDKGCKDCGAEWAPPVPRGVALFMLLCLGLFIIAMAAFLCVGVAVKPYSGVFAFPVLFAVLPGVGVVILFGPFLIPAALRDLCVLKILKEPTGKDTRCELQQ